MELRKGNDSRSVFFGKNSECPYHDRRGTEPCMLNLFSEMQNSLKRLSGLHCHNDNLCYLVLCVLVYFQ